MIIRDATLDDAAALARVHVAAWRAGYRGMMPDAFLDALDPTTRGDRWRAILAGRGRDKRLFVAVEGDELVGFADVGPLRPAPERDRGELYAINVHPRAWGSGVSVLLLDRATRALAELGFRGAVLWCLRGNARARRFYERESWRTDGAELAKAVTEGGITITLDEVRYYRLLA